MQIAISRLDYNIGITVCRYTTNGVGRCVVCEEFRSGGVRRASAHMSRSITVRRKAQHKGSEPLMEKFVTNDDPRSREVFRLLIYVGPSLARGTPIWIHGRQYPDRTLLQVLANSFLVQCPRVFPM